MTLLGLVDFENYGTVCVLDLNITFVLKLSIVILV